MATAVAHDLAPYLVILAAVGSRLDSPRLAATSNRLLIVLLAAALVVNADRDDRDDPGGLGGYAEDRAGITTVAYRTQGALAFWPLLFLTARCAGPSTAFLIFATVFFVLAQQVLFQKRSPPFASPSSCSCSWSILPALRARAGRARDPRGAADVAFRGRGRLAVAAGPHPRPLALPGPAAPGSPSA